MHILKGQCTSFYFISFLLHCGFIAGHRVSLLAEKGQLFGVVSGLLVSLTFLVAEYRR